MAEGIVVSIHLASGATEPMRGVAEARAVSGRGLRPLRDPSEFDEYEFPMPESGEPSL